MKLKGKVALITGSSRGIGKSTALLLAKEGAKIIVDYFVSDIELDADKNAAKVVNEIKKIGSDAIAIECDVSDEEQVKKLILLGVKKFGKIDILVNNAGIVFDFPLSEKTVKQWKQTLDTNLLGVFLCSKYASRHMPNGGKIINISSTNGINSFNPHSMDYDASKAGIIILTRNLAKEFAPKILVNSIAPGWVNTDMNKDLPKEFIKEESNKIYLKRFAEPEEISKVVLFLSSDDSNYITGTTIMVDGGYG
jgi:3-oxoacyl-[acyl-carrier protein] reductase